MLKFFRNIWSPNLQLATVSRHIESLTLLTAASTLMLRNLESTGKNYLWEWELRVYSQWGEDGIIDFIINKLQIPHVKFLEIGAGNFLECNSRFAAEFHNASVFAVDARHDLVSTCKSLDIFWKGRIFPRQKFVTPDNAQEILDEALFVMEGVDILSIDIDGNDYWVLSALDLSEVKCVVVEINPLFGAKFPITIPREDFFDRTVAHFSWLYFGMSFKAAVQIMKSKGFDLIGSNRVGNNLFFVQDSSANIFAPYISTAHEFRDAKYWKVRESRDEQGALSYKTPEECVAMLGRCNVLNVNSLEITELRDLEVE